MVTKQTSKSLCKKLSALRAILSDDEQALLDLLLLTQTNYTYQTSDKDEGESNQLRAVSPQRVGIDPRKNGRICVQFDEDREVYFVE